MFLIIYTHKPAVWFVGNVGELNKILPQVVMGVYLLWGRALEALLVSSDFPFM